MLLAVLATIACRVSPEGVLSRTLLLTAVQRSESAGSSGVFRLESLHNAIPLQQQIRNKTWCWNFSMCDRSVVSMKRDRASVWSLLAAKMIKFAQSGNN